MSKLNTASGGVRYRTDLGNKPYIERVDCMWTPNRKSGIFCTLYRFDKLLVNFMATPSQAKKIESKRREGVPALRRRCLWLLDKAAVPGLWHAQAQAHR